MNFPGTNLTIKRVGVAVLMLLVLDFLWIWLYMGRQYGKMIPRIQGSELKMNILSSVAAYFLMVVALIYLVLPNIRSSSLYRLQDSIRYGALFGLVAYGIYDFTAGAVFKNWDFNLAIIDICWGAFVYAITVYIASMV